MTERPRPMERIDLDHFMAQGMPTRHDTYKRPGETHGLLEGDRVVITEGELKGAYGKVMDAHYGCNESCRFKCYLVHVELMAKPPGVKPLPVRSSWLGDNVLVFKASEVSHAD